MYVNCKLFVFQGGVTIEELKTGTGKEAKKGNFVGMYYSGNTNFTWLFFRLLVRILRKPFQVKCKEERRHLILVSLGSHSGSGLVGDRYRRLFSSRYSSLLYHYVQTPCVSGNQWMGAGHSWNEGGGEETSYFGTKHGVSMLAYKIAVLPLLSILQNLPNIIIGMVLEEPHQIFLETPLW